MTQVGVRAAQRNEMCYEVANQLLTRAIHYKVVHGKLESSVAGGAIEE